MSHVKDIVSRDHKTQRMPFSIRRNVARCASLSRETFIPRRMSGIGTYRTLDACAFRVSFNPEIGLTIVASACVYNRSLNACSRFDGAILRPDPELESPAAEIGIEIVDVAPAIMCPDASISTLT